MKKRILLVEDEQAICETLTDLFVSQGYSIKSLNNGSEALQAIKLYRPHLVISDIMMPRMNGMELLARLKSSPECNDVPVILLTAKKQFEDRIAGLETGADAYIAKPFNFYELQLTVRNLLGLKANILRGSFLHEEAIGETDAEVLFVSRLTKFLGEHLTDPDLSLLFMASHFKMSVSGFEKKLKRATGKSSRDFVRGFRLDKSMEYLKTQMDTLSQVAYKTGFKSLAHFSDSFKKHFGKSPSMF